MITKLNLGCDQWRIPGFINIDRVRLSGHVDPDVVCDAAVLPFAGGSIHEIYMGHLLEHFDLPGSAHLLRECARVLEDGGSLYVVVPDLQRALTLYSDGRLTVEELQGAVFGARTRREQDHCQIFTEALLVETLRRYFGEVRSMDLPACPHIVSQAGWQAAAVAARPLREEVARAECC